MTNEQHPWRRSGGALHVDLKVIPNAKADKAGGVVGDADGRPRLVLRLQASTGLVSWERPRYRVRER